MTKKVEKGGYGYFFWEKQRRAAVTLGMFLLPVLLFITGYVQTGTRKNLFTLVAILGCLPACKSLVGWVMVMPRKSMEREVYERIREHAGGLRMAYDLYFTTYEKNILVDAVAIRGSTVVGYCSGQEHRKYFQEYIQNTLSKNGCPATVRLLEDLRPFLNKLDAMSGTFEEGKHFGENREEQIRRTLLAIIL